MFADLVITGYIAAVVVLSTRGLLTPYIAAGGAIGLCSWLDPSSTVSTVIGCYVVSHLLNGVNEFAGINLDATTALGADSLVIEHKNFTKYLVLKPIILGACIALPIGKPSGYITGGLGLALACVLLLCNKKKLTKKALIAIVIQSVVLGGLMLLFSQQHTMGTLGLIAAVAIPSLLFPSNTVPTQAYFAKPGATGIAATGLLTWLTPGLSMQPISTVFMGHTVYKPMVLSLLNSALEGWNLHQFATGNQSAKTPLGDLITNKFVLITPTQAQVGILAALICLWIFILVKPQPTYTKNQSYWQIGGLLAQAVVTAGWTWTLLFLIAGAVVHILQQLLAPEQEDIKSLAFLVPTILS
jgi:hypothetical protein